jgi:ribonuclease P protein component
MAKQFTLGKDERLKSRKAIEQLFKEGKSFAISPFRVYYSPAPLTVQFGVGVSTRNFKKAVDRNKIKRLMREAYRLQKISLVELLKEKQKGVNIFFIYTGKELPDYKLVSTKVNLILNKLQKLLDENNTSNS